MSGMRVRTLVDDNPGRKLDEVQPPKPRAPRPNQLGPQNAPGNRNKRKAADDADEGNDGRSRSNFKDWELRKQGQNDAWDKRRAGDVAALIASMPSQAEQQAARRATELAALQAALNAAVPSHFCPMADDNASGSGGSSGATSGSGGTSGSADMGGGGNSGGGNGGGGNGGSGASRLTLTTSTTSAVYHGLGGVVGIVVQPIYCCSSCGEGGIRVHPLQVSCVPTAPTINSILLSIELVEQYRLLWLKNGVSGHGKHACINATCCCFGCPCHLPRRCCLPASLVAAPLVQHCCRCCHSPAPLPLLCCTLPPPPIVFCCKVASAVSPGGVQSCALTAFPHLASPTQGTLTLTTCLQRGWIPTTV